MGYMTRYDGEVKLNNEKVKALVRLMLDDSDCDGTMSDWGNHLFESKLKNDKLIVDEDRKNYEGEMEHIFSLIVHFDDKAEGKIVAEGEDGEGKERFILKNGIVFREEGYIEYKNKEDISEDIEEDEDLLEQLENLTNENMCENCNKIIDSKFIFRNRGYFEEINEKYKYDKICENCYGKLKKPFAEIRKLKQEINEREQKIKQFALDVKDGGQE
jgi:hypothetical protein